MGGHDKGWQTLAGKPLVQWALERLSPQVSTVLISANRNIERYQALGYPVVADQMFDTGEEFAGPLAGLQAAMQRTQTPWLLTVPCDSPQLPLDLVSRLCRAADEQHADLAVPTTEDRNQSAISLVLCSLLPQLTEFLASGGRGIGDWHKTLHMIRVSFDDQVAAFSNINTPEDLLMESARLGRQT